MEVHVCHIVEGHLVKQVRVESLPKKVKVMMEVKEVKKVKKMKEVKEVKKVKEMKEVKEVKEEEEEEEPHLAHSEGQPGHLGPPEGELAIVELDVGHPGAEDIMRIY